VVCTRPAPCGPAGQERCYELLLPASFDGSPPLPLEQTDPVRHRWLAASSLTSPSTPAAWRLPARVAGAFRPEAHEFGIVIGYGPAASARRLANHRSPARPGHRAPAHDTPCPPPLQLAVVTGRHRRPGDHRQPQPPECWLKIKGHFGVSVERFHPRFRAAWRPRWPHRAVPGVTPASMAGRTTSAACAASVDTAAPAGGLTQLGCMISTRIPAGACPPSPGGRMILWRACERSVRFLPARPHLRRAIPPER